MTPLNKITNTGEVLESDQYQITFIAYDEIKKCGCFLTFPNVQTSWIYSISY